MAVLNVSSAAASTTTTTTALLVQQQQPEKHTTFSRFYPRASTLHCLPEQNSTVLFMTKELSPQDAISIDSSKKSQAPSLQHQALLEQLALELERKKPSDKPTDPAARAVASLLCHVQQVSDVDVFLHDLNFDPRVYTTAIQKLGHWQKVDAAFHLLQWLRSRPTPEERPNVYIYSSILGAMKSCHDFRHFSFVMEDMRKHGIEPNLITYNNIIECYEQQGLRSEAIKSFHALIQQGLVPNRATFRALLWGSEKSSDIRKALDMFTSAREIVQKAGMDGAMEELRETVSTFYAGIISVELLVGKHHNYIIRCLEMAEMRMLQLSARHYDDILWDCGSKPKDFLVAKFILKCRRKLSPPLDVRLCNHVMRFMGKEKKWWAALEVFEQMVEGGPPPDSNSYAIIRSHFNLLLKASKERRTCNWNVQLLEKMAAHGIHPDQYAWDTTLVACALKVDPDLAINVFKKMIDKGHQPSVLSYGALLSTLQKGGLYGQAEQVWEHMKKLGVKPNTVAYTIMISVYGGLDKYEELKNLLDEMYAVNVPFTLITYNMLITLCAKTGDGEGALEWMQQLSNAGLKPDVVSYSQLVIALSRGGQVELVKSMCVEAKQSLSKVDYESLIKTCVLHNIEFNAEEIPVCPELWHEKHMSIEFDHKDSFHLDSQPGDVIDAGLQMDARSLEMMATPS